MQSIREKRSFLSGLFFDNYGGIYMGQILHICGMSGSGKTLLSTYLSLRFLHSYIDGKVIYFDADRMLSKQDLEKMCRSNAIPIQCLEKLNVYIPTDWKDIKEKITRTITKSPLNPLFFIIDSLPNVFLCELYAITTDTGPKKEHIVELIGNITEFFVFLKEKINFNKNILIAIVNQVRGLFQKTFPQFWRSKRYIPTYWNIIQYFIDTCIILEKIRQGIVFTRILFSQHYPETLGIIRIDNLKIT